MTVEYSKAEHGIGKYDVFSDTIVLHSKLKEHPELHAFILKHEKQHMINNQSEKAWFERAWIDAKIDYKDNWFIYTDEEFRRHHKLLEDALKIPRYKKIRMLLQLNLYHMLKIPMMAIPLLAFFKRLKNK